MLCHNETETKESRGINMPVRMALGLVASGIILQPSFLHAQDMTGGEVAPYEVVSPAAQDSASAAMPPFPDAAEQSVTGQAMNNQNGENTQKSLLTDGEKRRSIEIAHQIAEINESMALMSAQLAELDLKMQIAQKKKEIEDIGKPANKSEAGDTLNNLAYPPSLPFGTSIPQSQGVSGAMPPMGVSSVSGLPKIVSIDGIDGDLSAVLNVDGGLKKVRVGDRFSGWRVENITPDSVKIAKGKKVEEIYVDFTGPDKPMSYSSASYNSPAATPSMGQAGIPQISQFGGLQ